MKIMEKIKLDDKDRRCVRAIGLCAVFGLGLTKSYQLGQKSGTSMMASAMYYVDPLGTAKILDLVTGLGEKFKQ